MSEDLPLVRESPFNKYEQWSFLTQKWPFLTQNCKFLDIGGELTTDSFCRTPIFLGIPSLKSHKWGPHSTKWPRYGHLTHFPLFSNENPFVTMKNLKKLRFSQNPRRVARNFIWWTPPHLGSTELLKLVWGQNSPRGRRYSNVIRGGGLLPWSPLWGVKVFPKETSFEPSQGDSLWDFLWYFP